MNAHYSHGFRKPGFAQRTTQQGVALVVALILLVVITLVGLASIGGTIMQNKAASNQYDRQIAFQASAAALREAAVAIENATTNQKAPAGFEDCSATSGNVCLADPFKDTNVPKGQIVTVSKADFNAGAIAAQQPQYVVQYLGSFLAPAPSIRRISNAENYNAGGDEVMADYYRITARSGNPSTVGARAIVVLQSTFRN